MPGPFNYQEGICLIRGFDKYEALYNMNIRDIMSSSHGIQPQNILFSNDAASFLDGELLAGAATGYNHAIGITLGTGLGSASSYGGLTRDAGLGALQYEDGIIEDFISTRGLLRTYNGLSGRNLPGVKELAALHGVDEIVQETFRLFSERLAWFLGRFISMEDKTPEVLVVGGNITHCWQLFMPQAIQQMKYLSVDIPPVFRAKNGEYAALIGAAAGLFATQMRDGKNFVLNQPFN
ncbi:MAG: ROK family protein [Bacteroidetes bacterium]|nr:ROK family protein [Bacteroidota bacterium]